MSSIARDRNEVKQNWWIFITEVILVLVPAYRSRIVSLIQPQTVVECWVELPRHAAECWLYEHWLLAKAAKPNSRELFLWFCSTRFMSLMTTIHRDGRCRNPQLGGDILLDKLRNNLFRLTSEFLVSSVLCLYHTLLSSRLEPMN